MANGTVENAGGELPDPQIPGEIKRGRGRPPGSKSHSKKSEVANPISERKADAQIDAAFLADGLCDIAAIGENLFYRILIKRIQTVIPEKVPEFAELCEKQSLNEKDRALCRRVIQGLAKKYNFLDKFGPEILAIMGFLQYTGRQIYLVKFVEGVEKRMKSADKVPVNTETSTDDGKT